MALNYKIIGERIQEVRKKKKITQQVLAEKLGLSVSAISRMECGKLKISLPRLNQICELLNVTEGFILNGVSSNSSIYLGNDFNNLLMTCSPKDKQLIYAIAKTVQDINSQNKFEL